MNYLYKIRRKSDGKFWSAGYYGSWTDGGKLYKKRGAAERVMRDNLPKRWHGRAEPLDMEIVTFAVLEVIVRDVEGLEINADKLVMPYIND